MSRYKKLGGILTSIFVLLISFSLQNKVLATLSKGANTPDYLRGTLYEDLPGVALKCHWQNNSKVVCSGDGAPTTFSIGGIVVEQSSKNNLEYFFDKEATERNKHVVFKDNGNRAGYLHFSDLLTTGNITNSPDIASNGIDNLETLQFSENIDKPPESGKDGVSSTEIGKKAIDKTKEAEKDKQTCDKNAGTLSFIYCPLLGTINNTIASLIGGTSEGSTLGGGPSPPKQGLFIDLMVVNYDAAGIQSVIKAFTNIANAFFIVIFLIIIFSTTLSIGLDSYAVKKMLPRFVAAVIMVQFSYLIVAILVDIGNIIGIGIINVFDGINNDLPNNVGELGSSMGQVLGPLFQTSGLAQFGFFLILILALIALISALIGTIAMILRQFLIILLMVAAPIAFALWVLPNTEKFFKMWWENLLKAVMMFPIVAGMISAALFFAKASDQIFPGSEFRQLIAALFPMIALIFVPKAFKWGGQLMAATSGAVAARLTGAAKAPAKAVYGQARKAAGEAIGKKGTELAAFGKSAASRAAGRVMSGRIFSTGHGVETAGQKLLKEYTEEEKDRFSHMDRGQLRAHYNQQMMQAARNPNNIRAVARSQALAAALTDIRDEGGLHAGRNAFMQAGGRQDNYESILRNSGKSGDIFERHPSVFTGNYEALRGANANRLTQITPGELTGALNAGAINPNSIREALTNTTIRANLSPASLEALNNAVSTTTGQG